MAGPWANFSYYNTTGGVRWNAPHNPGQDPWRAWAGIDEDDYLDEDGEPIDHTPSEQWEVTTPDEVYHTNNSTVLDLIQS